jgi:alcohol dehydrogenase class IV
MQLPPKIFYRSSVRSDVGERELKNGIYNNNIIVDKTTHGLAALTSVINVHHARDFETKIEDMITI